jgi:chemotaxis protein MotB
MPIEPPHSSAAKSALLTGLPSETGNTASPPNPPRKRPMHSFHSHWDSGADGNIDIPSHWSVPWADLMMVMMVMFAVMFSTKLAERNVGDLFKKDAPTTTRPEPLRQAGMLRSQPDTPKVVKSAKLPVTAEEILRLSEKLVAEANLENIDVVLTENKAIKVSVRGNLLFDSGTAQLKPDAISFLNNLAKIIAANNYQIEVLGHTDNFPISTPEYPTNWELSAARAARVARYLIQAGNLEPGRFTIIGHALYRPMVPNATLADKAKNRRVEIVITRNEYKP